MPSETEMILGYQSWPCYPVLPVKQRQARGMPPMGIIIAPDIVGRNEGDPVHVYKKNLYDVQSGPLVPQLEGVEKNTYDSIEKMLAAGWVVD